MVNDLDDPAQVPIHWPLHEPLQLAVDVLVDIPVQPVQVELPLLPEIDVAVQLLLQFEVGVDIDVPVQPVQVAFDLDDPVQVPIHWPPHEPLQLVVDVVEELLHAPLHDVDAVVDIPEQPIQVVGL